MKKFSVVIPVYNCGKYITTCLESIKNQTFTDYEIIIVNDNSTDMTGINVARFMKQNPYIDLSVIYNKTNLGVSASRNIGIKEASGEFILFVDGDDYYCNNEAFEIFSSKLKKDTDILIFGCNVEHLGNDDKKILPTITFIPKERDSQAKHELSPFKPLKTVWQLCCRRDFLIQKGIQFQEDITIFEDVIFRQQAVAMSNSILTTDMIAYTYNRRIVGAKSLTISKDNNYIEQLRKLAKATRRIGELAKQYDFPPETEKYFKRTVLEVPQAVFHITTSSLFSKFYQNHNNINTDIQMDR